MNLIISTIQKNSPLAIETETQLKSHGIQTELIETQDLKISHCIGCNDCWIKTPGICCIKDDYEQILIKILQADRVIFISDTRLGFVSSFALPLFVECVPGLMLEFLETLTPKTTNEAKTQISFLLQGGFAEASQFRCGERYLEMLPDYLGCEYGGTLIKGNMFITHMLPEKAQQQTVSPFYSMGEQFAADNAFDKKKVNEFAKPEYFSKGFIFINTILDPLKKLFFHLYFGKMGCSGSLRARPYAKYLKK